MKRFEKYKLKVKAKEQKRDTKEKRWTNSIVNKTLDKICPKCNKDLREANFSFSGSCGYYNYSNYCCEIKCQCGYIIFVNKKWMKNSWKIIGHTSLVYDARKEGNRFKEFKAYAYIHRNPEYFC